MDDIVPGVISRGNAVVPIYGRLHAGTHWNGFTLLKCFRTFCIAQFYNYNLAIFLERISPDFRKSSPGAWTQASVSAWLASVSIVPVLRNDHCIAHLV